MHNSCLTKEEIVIAEKENTMIPMQNITEMDPIQTTTSVSRSTSGVKKRKKSISHTMTTKEQKKLKMSTVHDKLMNTKISNITNYCLTEFRKDVMTDTEQIIAIF